MAFLALFTNLAFYHLSLLAFFLGAQIYQSFFANIIAQRALTRSQFSILMAAIWPMYSKLQMIVSVLLALTYPGGGGEAAFFQGSASVRGLFDTSDRWTVVLPLAMMVVSSAANALVVIPKTVSVMWKMHVETAREEKARGISGSQSQEDKINSETVRDRKAIQKDGPKSPELKALTYKFHVFHAGSFVCNMATVAASICYALCVAKEFL